MKKEQMRVLITLVVFAVVYLLAGPIIGGTGSYDIYVQSIKFLAAVIAAGSYWIGSRS